MLGMVSWLMKTCRGSRLTCVTDKPDELLESDSKYPQGHNPVVGTESPANK
jgi:glycerol-3-phosphate dehydrogenase